MAAEPTQEVRDRLCADHYGWPATVARSGQPVPRLVWFYFDGTDPRQDGPCWAKYAVWTTPTEA